MFLVVMGAAFALVGAVVDGLAAVQVFPTSLLLMGSIFVLTGVILLAVGIGMVRSARGKARLLATGLAGTATISSVRQTSMMVNNQPVLAFELLVQVPGRPPYTATLRELIPFIRLAQVQPGNTLAVRVDPARPERVAIDWGASVTTAQPFGIAPARQAPQVPDLPRVPDGLPPDQLRAQVCAYGAPGRAILDAVRQVGPDRDMIMFSLSMWVQLDSGPAYRVEDSPALVEPRYTVLVRPGTTVPLHTAQVRPGVTVTVLEWERLSD